MELIISNKDVHFPIHVLWNGTRVDIAWMSSKIARFGICENKLKIPCIMFHCSLLASFIHVNWVVASVYVLLDMFAQRRFRLTCTLLLSFRHPLKRLFFFTLRFNLNENSLFWLTISYQKPFVFSVSVFCSQIKFTAKIGLTYAISIVKGFCFLILFKKIFFFTFLCWV